MLSYNKIVLLPTIQQVHNILRNQPINIPFYIYNDRFAIERKKYKNSGFLSDPTESIRIWKTKCLLDWWYNDQSTGTFIGALDYVVLKDKIKIDYINIRDYEYNNMYKHSESLLTQDQSQELLGAMVDYVKLFALEEKKTKITLSVHNNLRLYNLYFKNLGFALNGYKDPDNNYWLETEIILQEEEYPIK